VTSSEIPARRDRWLRAVGFGFLAELSTVLTIILIVAVYRYVVAAGLPDDAYAAFAEQTGEMVGIVGGAVYTFIFAGLVTRSLNSRFLAHGIVVAATAVTFSVAGSLAGHHGLPAAYALASALKLGVGAFAGFLSAKGEFLPA
jgi:hypothetical protein